MPKEATAGEREAGMCTMSQYPTQAARMVSTAGASQSQSHDLKTIDGQSQKDDNRRGSIRKEVKSKSKVMGSKRSKLSTESATESSGLRVLDSVCRIISTTENKATEIDLGGGGGVSKSVPDVAAAIEDLLEQTSKVKKKKKQIPIPS